MKTPQNPTERRQLSPHHVPPLKSYNLPQFFPISHFFHFLSHSSPRLCVSAFHILTFFNACRRTRRSAKAHGCRAFRKGIESQPISFSLRALSRNPFVTKSSNLLEFSRAPIFFHLTSHLSASLRLCVSYSDILPRLCASAFHIALFFIAAAPSAFAGATPVALLPGLRQNLIDKQEQIWYIAAKMINKKAWM